MNFLQLCKQTQEDCGISGTSISSVTGQTGELLRVVNWVNKAWEDIQNANENWEFMRAEFSFQTLVGTREYLSLQIASDHARWHLDSFRCYRTVDGVTTEQFMTPMDYQDFRNAYQFGAMNVLRGRPNVFGERPRDKALLLGPLPSDVYTIYGEYQQGATRLVAANDIPADGRFPDEFHQMIVDRAVMKYAAFEGAGALYATAQEDYKTRMRGLEKAQLPDIGFGEPLA